MTDRFFADEPPLDFADDDRSGSSTLHAVTQWVMPYFEFAGGRIDFINAFSGAEARELLRDRHDVALMLPDLVMETEHAGFDSVRYIREVSKNSHARIALRTGQPGLAPAEHVIKTCDINDCKKKKTREEINETQGATVDILCLAVERRSKQLGAVIAHEHHARWDGKGYPGR